jgi:branched-subunit amino acid aminotransferase/4-amino-4-deoxychorismate lyase
MSEIDSPDRSTGPTNSIYRWHEGRLELLDYCDMSGTTIAVADSWLVTDGTVLALDLHRARFLGSIDPRFTDDELDYTDFWDAVIAAIPRAGDWFPRVELQLREASGAEAALLVFRLRSAPPRSKAVRLATHPGSDPRSEPSTKGPDTAALLRARTAAQKRGADEAVIVSPEGYIVEGAYSAILWWRGEFICAPSLELERVESVTARSVVTLATALGVDVHYESVTPSELDGLEIWTLSALQGIRIVTEWVDGPAPAELPGRLTAWRARLDRLRRPLPE